MFGWFRAEADLASRSKRARRSASDEISAGSTLIATSRPRRVSRARYTSPIPPDPNGAITSYGPMRVPAPITNHQSQITNPLPSLKPLHHPHVASAWQEAVEEDVPPVGRPARVVDADVGVLELEDLLRRPAGQR